MPKSNFSQFLDECQDYRTFKSKPKRRYDESETQISESKTSESKEDVNVNCYSESGSSSTLNSGCGSSRSLSSNIFLSKDRNNKNKNVFSSNTSTRTNSTPNPNANKEISQGETSTNMFKKMDSGKNFYSVKTTHVPETSVPIIEISNETFPSLKPSVTTSFIADTKVVPKKFKNFKDALVHVSPTKQTQTKEQAFQRSRPVPVSPPPLVVKRDSEVYAKKMLAKKKGSTAFYDSDNDENYDDYSDCDINQCDDDGDD